MNKKIDSDTEIYEKMKKLSLWTIDEGLMILNFPQYTFESPADFIDDIAKIHMYELWYREDYLGEDKLRFGLMCIIRAIDSGDLKAIKKDRENSIKWCYANYRVSPFMFLKFIKERDLFEIPPELDYIKAVNDAGKTVYRWADNEPSTQTQGGTKEDQPASPTTNTICIDLEHPQLSEELKIAIQAWDAVYVCGELINKLGHLDNIKGWIKAHHPSLKETPLKRIATVVNPNKAGGAPRMATSKSDQ